MSIQTKIWSGFSMSVLALCLAVFAGYQATQYAIEKSSWVDHTYEVVSLIDSTITHFKDAETGQRGYLLTGNSSYLEPYESGTANISSTLSRAKDLTIDNPRQQQRVAQIERLSSAKLLELQETIDHYNAGNQDKAFEVVLTDRGKQVMDEIRAVIQEMKTEEQNLLATRKLESQSAVQKLIYISSVGGILIVSGLIVVLFAFFRSNTRRYLVEHNQTEQELHDEVRHLQQALTEMGALQNDIRVCTTCKAICDDRGTWEELETFLDRHSAEDLSHEICSTCMTAKS
jgi:CHASE3 domain sensor protein